MEELLRESACTGNLEGVQKLLQNGSAINSQNSMNGWTALHWACKRGHTAVVHFLLQSGADVNIRTHYGQTPLDITSSPEVVKLLGGGAENLAEAAKKELPIVPNYLANPPFPYYDITREIETAKYGDAGTIAKTGLHKLNSRAHDNTTMPGRHDSSGDTPLAKHLASLTVLNDVTKQKSDVILSEAKGSTSWSSQAREEEQVPFSHLHPQGRPLLLKVRVAGSSDSDFVELEFCSPSYQALLRACCEELELQPSDVLKIRKLPNVWVRKDRDVQRMREGQELEVVVRPEVAACHVVVKTETVCNEKQPKVLNGSIDESRT